MLNHSLASLTLRPSGNKSSVLAQRVDYDAEIQTALTTVLTLSQSQHDVQSVRAALRQLETLSFDAGLSSKQLDSLFSLVTSIQPSSQMKSVYVKQIWESMLPRQQVHGALMVQFMGWLSHVSSRGHVDLQSYALQWLVKVLSVLSDRAVKVVRACYGVLFYFLSYETLRPFVCQILHGITRKQHVKPFRVRRLQDLLVRAGPEAPLVTLLRLYKEHAPDLVTMSLPAVRGTFKPMSQNWMQQLHRHCQVSSQESFNLPPQQRLYKNFLPSLQSSDRSLVPLLDIQNMQQLAQHWQKWMAPKQAISLLSHPLLWYWLVARADSHLLLRMDRWLSIELTLLLDRVFVCSVAQQELKHLLENVHRFALFSGEMFSSVEQFLFQFLRLWNGKFMQEEIFSLLVLISPGPFYQIYGLLLQPLHRLFVSGSVSIQVKILKCLRELVRHWLLLEKRKSKVDFDFSRLLYELCEHVDRLSRMALMMHPDHVLLQHEILSFMELSSDLYRIHKVPCIALPNSALVDWMLSADTAMPVNRLCGVISSYKNAIELYEASASQHRDAGRSSLAAYEDVRQVNCYVMDLCNALWRNRAFNRSDPHAAGLRVHAQFATTLAPYSCASQILSLTHHVAFLSFCFDFVSTQWRHSAPLSSHAIQTASKASPLTYAEWRVALLDHLKQQRHCHGVYEFLYRSISSLIKKQPQV